MKKILEFNEEENVEFQQASLGSTLSIIIWEYDQKLRNLYKYEDKEWASDARDLLREVIEEEGITFDHPIFR